MKICILTDDRVFARMLELELFEWGYETVKEEGGAELYLCDLDSCRLDKIREISERAQIFGYYRESGDDTPASKLCACIFKRPFLMSELEASMHSISSGKAHEKRQESRVRVSEFGRRKNMLVCNRRACEAVFGSYTIKLSPTEADVLSLLCDRRGQTVSREELGSLFERPDGNVADVYICKLRAKIDNTLGVKFIYTIKGKGYMLK